MTSVRDVFIGFLENWTGEKDEYRTLLTVSLFLIEDDRVDGLALSTAETQDSPALNEDLVTRILDVCSPLEMASVLWSVIGLMLSPRAFTRAFRHVYGCTHDLGVLHPLGGAVNDYLRRHPKCLAVPEDLSGRLLTSNDVNHRIIGMKLLKHTTLPLSVVIDCFVEALNAGANEQEHYGALYEIGEVLDNVNIDAWESLDSELAANFVKTLESLAMKTDEVEIADACRRNISRVHNKRFGPADDV